MRRLITTSLITIAMVGTSAAAASAVGVSASEPKEDDAAVVMEAAGDDGDTDETEPEAAEDAGEDGAELEAAGAATGAVTVVDETGSPVAAVTVTSVTEAWTDYGEHEAPRRGNYYLRATVLVESHSPRGLVEVDGRDFFVQDADGFVFDASSVLSAEQEATMRDPVFDADLSQGETVELELTFELVDGVGPQALYYSPGRDRLITVMFFG